MIEAENGGATVHHVVAMRFWIGIFDECWLRYRFGLLESVTIPSLKKQDWRGSELLVQVDELIPGNWLERLENLVSGLPVAIQKLKLHRDRRPELLRHCKARATDGVTHLLTSRIDDDDAISIGGIKAIRDEALHQVRSGHNTCALAIRSGLWYLAESGMALGMLHSAFSWRQLRFLKESGFALRNVMRPPDPIGLSVLMPTNDARNVYSWNHKKIPVYFSSRQVPLVFIEKERAQTLYTIHRMNDTNYLKRKKSILGNRASLPADERVSQAFGINLALLDGWRQLDAISPTLSSGKTTSLVDAVERQIVEERKRASGDDALARLYKLRHDVGSRIVESLGS